jgi:DNA-binding MarR family transcriptional regulator
METEVNAPLLRLEAFLPYRLNVLATTVSESLASLYSARYGFGIPEWRVLATLGQFGRMTARDIGAHSRMHKTTVSRAVTELVARGYVKREANRADMREAFLSLKPRGRAVYDDLVPTATAFAARVVEGLSGEDRAALDRIVDHLAKRAEIVAGEIRRETTKDGDAS